MSITATWPITTAQWKHGEGDRVSAKGGATGVQRSANTEAITHFTAALELLQTVPETPERTQQELTLQLALAPPLTVTKGYTAPEVEAVYTRALALCRQIGETPQLFPALWGAANLM